METNSMKKFTITHVCETFYDEWDMNQVINRGASLVSMKGELLRFVKMKDADNNNFPYEFRMRDDDGDTYFYGKCADHGTFLPLDQYGEIFGCTEIQFKNANGEWETL